MSKEKKSIMRKIWTVVVVLLLVIVGSNIPMMISEASDCVIDDFSASPGSPVTVGQIVTFHRKAHCGNLRAIRQTFNGNPWGEYGGPEDSRTWNTGAEYGAGTYQICLQVAESGNDSWSGVTQKCMDYTVNPAAPPPPQVPTCQITGMDPGSNIVQPANQARTISASASCSTGVRSMRVLVNDSSVYELGSSSISYSWPGSGPSNVLWRICVQASGSGDDNWSYKAERCITIQVEDQGHPVDPIAPPVDTGNQQQQQQPQQNPVSPTNVPPVIVPTRRPDCTYNVQPRLVVGQTGRSTKSGANLNVRAGAGLSNGVVTTLPNGGEFSVLSGPSCVDGYYWWQISYNGVTGWVAEGDTGSYYVEPWQTQSVVYPTEVPASPATLVPSVQPTQSVIPIYASAGDGNGGINFSVYCQFRYGGTEYREDGNARSWSCVQNGNRIGLNYDQVCQDIYGPARPVMVIADETVLTSLSCQPAGAGGLSTGVLPAIFADAQTSDGGIDTNRWCQHHGFSTAQHSDSGADVAYSHRCLQDQTTWPINWDLACREAYGGGYNAQLISADEVGGWKCVQQENPFVDPGDGKDPRATTPTPVPQPVTQPGSQAPVTTGGNVGSVCPPSLLPRLTVGGLGRSLYAVMPIWSDASINSTNVANASSGGTFTVISGPTCNESVNWWLIDYGGSMGWIPEGYKGTYYVEPYTAPVTQQPQQPAPIDTGTSPKSVSYYYSPFGMTYTFLVNDSDLSNCVIVNGSEIVAQEINRSYGYFSTIYSTRNIADADYTMGLYLMNGGDIDTFRVLVDTILVRDLHCLHSYYKIGNADMDLSGLGNIMFGYYSYLINEKFALGIGHLDQLIKDHRPDFPDDQSQIKLGRAIANSGSTASPSLVESLIPSDFVNSQ